MASLAHPAGTYARGGHRRLGRIGDRVVGWLSPGERLGDSVKLPVALVSSQNYARFARI